MLYIMMYKMTWGEHMKTQQYKKGMTQSFLKPLKWDHKKVNEPPTSGFPFLSRLSLKKVTPSIVKIRIIKPWIINRLING